MLKDVLRRLAPPARVVREAGFVFTLDVLAGAMITVLTMGATLVGGTHILSTINNEMYEQSAWASMEGFETRLRSEARGANAVFTPADDVLGNSNCSGGSCNEVDLYTSDASHGGHFWAYRWTGSGSVQRYRYTAIDSSGTAQGVVADGNPVALTGFSVRDVPVTSLSADVDSTPATKAVLSETGYAPQRWTYKYEYPGVVGSNDIFYVHVAGGVRNVTTKDVVALVAGMTPLTQVETINGNYTPTPPPPLQVNPNNLTFQLPSGSQDVTAHEDYFHDPFGIQDGCGGNVASISPGSEYPNPNPVSPPGQNSGNADFSVSPNNPGSCSFSVTDTYGQSVSVSVTVLAPTPTPTGSGGGGGGGPQNYYIDTCPAAGYGTFEYTDGSGNNYFADGNASSGCGSGGTPTPTLPPGSSPAPTPTATPAGGGGSTATPSGGGGSIPAFCQGQGQDGTGDFYWIGGLDGSGAYHFGWIMDPSCTDGFVFTIETGGNCTDLAPCPTIAALATTNSGVTFSPTNLAEIMQGYDNQTGAVGVDFRQGLPWLVCQNLGNNAGSVEATWVPGWGVSLFQQMYLDATGTSDSGTNCSGVNGGGL